MVSGLAKPGTAMRQPGQTAFRPEIGSVRTGSAAHNFDQQAYMAGDGITVIRDDQGRETVITDAR